MLCTSGNTIYMYTCMLLSRWNLSNLGQIEVSLLRRCPDLRGCNVHKYSQMCPVY